ncbi:MAG: hypothetical protein Q9193_005085 [Seirophora villosa]
MPSQCSQSSCRSTHSVGSNVSPTSTETYEQVPYADYLPAVRELCHELWPSATQDFIIERLNGGFFNRIIGITAPDPATQVPTRYVLRIPRFLYARPDLELAIHHYVQEHTSIPIPQVIFSDPTAANVLETPYVVQARLPGMKLSDAFYTLNHDQRKDVVQQWARIILEEQAIKNQTAGVVEATEGPDGTRIYNVRLWDTRCPFASPSLQDVQLASDRIVFKMFDGVDPASDRNVLKMFLTQFKRWAISSTQANRTGDIYDLNAEWYTRLGNVAMDMDAAGLFKDNNHHLCHCDLESYNVLVEVHADDSAEIVGVLDWDSAVFAPMFVSCAPPWWIWNWNKEDVDEARANDTPADPEKQELKELFEDIVGPQFVKYAYEPEYRLARKLFSLAVDGLASSEHFREMEEIFEQWPRLKAQRFPTLIYAITERPISDFEMQSLRDREFALRIASKTKTATSAYHSGDDHEGLWCKLDCRKQQ